MNNAMQTEVDLSEMGFLFVSEFLTSAESKLRFCGIYL